MDGFIALGILLVIALPVAAIAGFFIALGARSAARELGEQFRRLDAALNHIGRRVDQMERRIAALEGGAPLPAPVLDERGAVLSEPQASEEMERRRRAAAEFMAADRLRRPRTEPAAEGAEAATEPEAATAPAEAVEEAVAAREAAAAEAAPPSTPARPGPARGFEETIGTRWTVWVGGLALALGGIFLVKYSIEQGFFGPGMRIAFAALFAAVLLGAGEYLRRNELAQPIGALPAAHIPGVLTAAGTIAAFATVYGAHALYGFIGPAAAFLMMGAIGLGTMALAVLHGPWLAVLGVLGAYGSPVLIESDAPNVPALVLYLVAVTASAFGIARLRLWRWVAATALVLAVLWAFPILDELDRPDERTLWYIAYAAAIWSLVAGILVVSLHGLADCAEDRPTDRFAVAALSLAALLAFFGELQDDHGLAARLLAGYVLVGSFALAWRVPAVAPAALTGSLFAVVSALMWIIHVDPTFWNDTFARGADGIVALRPRAIADYLSIAVAGGAVAMAAGFLGAARGVPEADRNAGWFALAGTLGPVLMLVVSWIRVSGFEASFAFAGAGLVLAAAFGAATGILARQERADAPARAVAVYAVGTIAALGAGLAIGLEKGALTVALALIVPALAWVHRERPIATLRPLAGLVGLVVLARVLWDPRIVGDALGTTPIFNWLLYGYGIPAFGFGFAAWTFRRSGDDAWQRLIEGLAVVFAGLLVLFEVRHLANDGDVFAPGSGPGEIGMLATMGFLMSAGLSRLAGRLGSRVYDVAAMVLTVFGVIFAGFGLLVFENPLFGGGSVGDGVIFNALLVGYLVPAAAAALAARLSTAGRPRWFATMLSGVALALAFAYVTLMVRKAYHGPVLWRGPETDPELWTYSAVWMAFGVVLLLAGIRIASQPARLASAAIIVLTVVKVFLIDMSALTGIWRALSFIGLGGVLIGIGLLYQRLLFPVRPPAPAQGEAEPTDDGPA